MIPEFGSWVYWALALVVLAALGVVFYDGVSNMAGSWSQEKYSHAYLIPVVSGLMIWRKREVLAATEVRGGGGLALFWWLWEWLRRCLAS